MLDQVNEMLELLLKDERFATNMAKLMKKNYNALLAEGFTAEEAIRIITSEAFKMGK